METGSILRKLSRRAFIRNSVIAATGATVLPSLLIGCKDKAIITPEGDVGFSTGVASFDPTQNGVILWTRYKPASGENQPVIVLDVSSDPNFGNVLVSETVQIDTASDFTVHVDVDNLTSNTRYYYRFRNQTTGTTSELGETRTLPAPGEAAQVRLAVVSCSNYQTGLFNVYGAVAESEADVVVHLGDYIYEYGTGEYGSNPMTVSLNRQHVPKGEIISLEDYRARYRQYRSDEQLRKAHRLKPFICVWDDHEIANNAYRDGAQNHQPAEGDFATRKAQALQVWHEYLSARVADPSRIYRSFDFAGLVKLVMLDTRVIGRDQQLSYLNYFGQTGLNIPQFLAEWQNPARTLLGAEQRNWLVAELQNSTARWQVLGSQVLMAKVYIPAELLLLIAQLALGNATPELLAQYTTLAAQLVGIKSRLLAGDPTLTDAEKARVQNVLPYNLDAWDGYPIERESVLEAALGKRLIALAGDTHNAWHSQLSSASGLKAGAEFATPSVSSPGMEAFFGTNPQALAAFEESNQVLVDDLQYVDASRRGYLLVTFDEQNARADYRYVSTLSTQSTATVSGYTAVEA